MNFGGKFVSLYCGCGGLDLGFATNGFQCAGAFDFEKSAIDTHRKNITGHAQEVDLSSPSDDVFSALSSADIILAGPPCQGFSTAGKNDPDDERNNHLFKVAELASGSSASIVVIENVRGLLAKKNQRHLALCLSKLEEAGFQITYKLFDLSKFGVAQSRKRVIIVASRTAHPIDLNAIPETKNLTVGDVISKIPRTPNFLEKSYALTSRDEKIASCIQPGQKLSNVRSGESSIHTWDIPQVFGETSQMEREILCKIIKLRRQKRIRDFGDADPISKSRLLEEIGTDSADTIFRLVDAGFLRMLGDFVDLSHTFNGKYKRLLWDELAPTVDTRFLQPRYFLHPLEDRGFTVAEMGALQTFPASFVFPESISQASRLIGNAVPPAFSTMLAKHLKEVIRAL